MYRSAVNSKSGDKMTSGGTIPAINNLTGSTISKPLFGLLISGNDPNSWIWGRLIAGLLHSSPNGPCR
jgi:hypothetical protein